MVVLAGEIGIALAGELRNACVEASDLPADVALDWADLVHVDAAALQVLVALRARVHEHGRRLTAGPPSGRLTEVLAMAGFRDGLVDGAPEGCDAVAAPTTS